MELRERWEERKQEDRGEAKTQAGQTHRIREQKMPKTQRKTVRETDTKDRDRQ